MEKIDKEELHSLFQGVANREKEKFNILYVKYKKLVNAIAFSITKNNEDAEDIVQIVFTKIWNMNEDNLPIKNESTWLYTLTKNETINFLRKQKPTINIDELYYMNKEDKQIKELLDKDAYNKIIAKLHPKEQEIVSLKILSNLSFREISEILDIPIGTVQWKYYKALHTLKILLSNLSMFLATISLFILQKSVNRNKKRPNVEHPEQENIITNEKEEIESDEQQTKNVQTKGEQSNKAEMEPNQENLENEEYKTNAEIKNNPINIESDIQNEVNTVLKENVLSTTKTDLGILSIAGIFLIITIIFSIIFIKNQQKLKKKLSKE